MTTCLIFRLGWFSNTPDEMRRKVAMPAKISSKVESQQAPCQQIVVVNNILPPSP